MVLMPTKADGEKQSGGLKRRGCGKRLFARYVPGKRIQTEANRKRAVDPADAKKAKRVVKDTSPDTEPVVSFARSLSRRLELGCRKRAWKPSKEYSGSKAL